MAMQLHLWQGFSDQIIESAKGATSALGNKFIFERMEVPQKQEGFRAIARTLALLTLLSQNLPQPFLISGLCLGLYKILKCKWR